MASLIGANTGLERKVITMSGIRTSTLGIFVTAVSMAQTDPGVRGGAPGAGGPLDGLTPALRALFQSTKDTFLEVASVSGTIPGEDGEGLGTKFNMNSCAGCHMQPAVGGTSPAVNPQVAVATLHGARNVVPSFITQNGPVREARFKRQPNGAPDGGVHALFTIAGRSDAPGCRDSQTDFGRELAQGNVIFRIPTPVFGSGLIESIPDFEILANRDADRFQKFAAGITGRENRSDNDGTITRFGWKAQNKSLTLFAGEAYNVEMGITNELFPNQREFAPGCLALGHPEDHTDFSNAGSSDVIRFALFMKLLAPPAPAPADQSITRGRALFDSIGCALCHTPVLRSGLSSIDALSNKPVNLFSDLLLHAMGPNLADEISQGDARGDEFRTAPLWGLGKRIFFLHDGRTRDLVAAITAHASPGNGRFPPSEANTVIARFNALPVPSKQDLINFLRSL